MIMLPWPPSANRYWRIFKGRIIVSKEAREYKAFVKNVSKLQKWKKIDGRLQLHIQAFPPDKRSRDLDNTLKVTIDALQYSSLFDNDSQIDRLSIERMDIIKGGMLKILISNT